MATLKTESPSTPDAIEDETEVQHHTPSPEQPGQTIQQKRRDGTSIGSRRGRTTGITSRRQTRIPEDWDNDSVATEIEDDQTEDIDGRLVMTWRNYGVHKIHRQRQIMDAATEIINKYNENEGKGKEVGDDNYTDTLIAVIETLAAKYQRCVQAKQSRASTALSHNGVNVGELRGSKGSPIDLRRRLADELRDAEDAEEDDMYEPMVQEESIKTPGQYRRMAPETPADQAGETVEMPDHESSVSSVSSSGVSEPIPAHVLPPQNWHVRVNNQRARDGEIREKGHSNIEDQGVRFRDHTPYDMWANPMGDIYVGPGIKKESSRGSSIHTPTPASAQQRATTSQGTAALQLTNRLDPLIGGITMGQRAPTHSAIAPGMATAVQTVTRTTGAPIAPITNTQLAGNQATQRVPNVQRAPSTTAQHHTAGHTIPPARSQRGFSMPAIPASRFVTPGVAEADENHRDAMIERLMDIIREALDRPMKYPDGFKPNIKTDSGGLKKYSGTSKFHDLEKWLSAIAYRYAILRLGGPSAETDRIRVVHLLEYIEGDALEWFTRHVLSPNRSIPYWTFCDVIKGMYERFIHPTSMQDAREGFRNTKYTPALGVQGFYDTLLDHAQNMAVYPDGYTILEEFLRGLPQTMTTKMFKDIGLSPEVNSLDDFVAMAKSIKQRDKTDAYYRQLHNKTSTNGTSTFTRQNVQRTKPQYNAKTNYQRDEQPRQAFTKPFRTDKRNKERIPTGNNKPITRPATREGQPEQTSSKNCYNCGKEGHFASKCPEPHKDKKVHMRAIRSTAGGDDASDADVEDEAEEPTTEREWKGTQKDESERAEEEASEIEVSAHDLYEFGSQSDFMTMITVKPLSNEQEIKNDHVTATVVAPLTKEEHPGKIEAKDNRKFRFRSTGNRRVRPVVKPEEKECLATWVKVGGLDAWTLWDSGSTMTGITPTFAEVAKIPLDTLEDPHVLQLGTVGSRSVIKYGANVSIEMAGSAFVSYVDVANFDRYDMIIGTPLLRKGKVLLDFINDQVVVNGKRIPAVKVQAKDLDPRLHRYRSTEKTRKQE